MVGWEKLDTSVYYDLAGYQILCNRGGSLQVFDTGSFSPGFTSAVSLVGSGQMTADGVRARRDDRRRRARMRRGGDRAGSPPEAPMTSRRREPWKAGRYRWPGWAG